MRLFKFQKLTIDKCALAFGLPLAIEKRRNCGVLLTLLLNLQTLAAFILALTSEQQLMTIKKSLFRNWPLILNFFKAHL
jgi:hypothetical protein